MSRRAISGGFDNHPPATSGSYAPDDFNSILPSTYAPLPRGEFAQALFDIGAVCAWMLLGLLGAAIVGGPIIVFMWILLFS